MHQITYCTTNKGKIHSAQYFLKDFGIEVVPEGIDIPEIRAEEVEDVAVHKAYYAYDKLRKPVMVMDAGFFVDSLKGFPKTYVNFALNTIGVEGILKLVKDLKRDCRFFHCLVYYDGKSKDPVIFPYAVAGKLADDFRGTAKDYFWSDLHYVFMPDKSNQTFAEMTPDEYHSWKESRVDENYYLNRFAEFYLGKNA